MTAQFDDGVEFLDLDEDGDAIDWLEESAGEDGVQGGRDPRRLPPHAARGRLLASVLSLALMLGSLGAAGSTAYHRHQTDVRVADTLKLTAASAAPFIPNLTQLAFVTTWHAHPTEQVLVPVVNKGPDTVTLMDGELTEAGLAGVTAFKPVGNAAVPPGGTGELAGVVTADCTTELDSALLVLTAEPNQTSPSGGFQITGPGQLGGLSVVSPGGDGSQTGTGGSQFDFGGTAPQSTRVHLGALVVRARAAGGRVGDETIYPETGLNTTAARICTQQGENVANVAGPRATADPATHVITVSLTATSVADVALDYHADAEFSTIPEAPGLVLPDTLSATAPVSGTVTPGGKVTLGFQVQITHCPGSSTPADENILFNLMFLLDGRLVSMQSYTSSVQPLISKACGLG
ncbi:hypothetical protein KDL01_07910 [Actinospica durhamensis]|uniref:Uncharacterized protein n=1 Tax=Actinospica durhamensis TaxID=1508375 RepID=A0A941ELL7_9ACTN|nr:hypothetical protein [Actinospica durhamensis]MBR7833185.1 hypothetical protein [Actinospica durhamensis]